MIPGTIDYAPSYFKHKTPSPIRGDPIHKSLKSPQTELQANASSVEIDLGGENHGYLGLVKTEADYAEISNTSPFDVYVCRCPVCPPALTIPENSPPIGVLELKEEQVEKKDSTYNAKML